MGVRDSKDLEATSVDSTVVASTPTPLGDMDKSEEDRAGVTAPGAEVKLSQGRKYFLLFIFSIAQVLDITCRSGVLALIDVIARDLNISYQTSSWIITSFAATFGSFLLFWGRVADLWSAKPVFVFGFLGLGITNLITSFMPNQYGYFVFRALSGIFASATIPSALKLIVVVFEPHEAKGAITWFGLSGALANAVGLIIGGVFGIDTATNQMAGWRWFFRGVTVIAVPFSVLAYLLVPKTKGSRQIIHSKWKQFDIPGSLSILASLLLLILALTLGASHGWKTAGFLAPFLLVWPLVAFFFWWETTLPDGCALVPHKTWVIPNVGLLLFLALGVFGYWPVVQLPLLERWQSFNHESVILSSVRILPMGIAAFLPVLFLGPILPKLNIRYFLVTGFTCTCISFILFIYSHGSIAGNDYWRWYFPGLIIGSMGGAFCFTAVNTTAITSVPPQMSGVMAALTQTCFQAGTVIALSIQAGLLTVKPGDITNYANIQASFWFEFGWMGLYLLVSLVLYRTRAPRAVMGIKGEIHLTPVGDEK